MKFGLGLGLCSSMTSSVSYNSQSISLFAAMTSQPSETRKTIINTFIASLVDNGYWNQIDAMYVYAAHDSQAARLNWKTPGTKTAIIVNSPTFTADQGYAGDGLTSYVNTTFNPFTDCVAASQNDFVLMNYSRTDSSATGADCGARTATETLYIIPRDTGFAYIRNNSGSGGFSSAVNTDSRGLFASYRSDSANQVIYKNGSSLGTSAVASTGLVNSSVWSCAWNLSGAFVNGTNHEQSLLLIGKASAISMGNFRTYFQNYMTSLGTQV